MGGCDEGCRDVPQFIDIALQRAQAAIHDEHRGATNRNEGCQPQDDFQGDR
ncbi:MAG: hypothetical protein LC799_02965 [Actinobacteria bacterium]|nr:hypothetical protein [Actinomycetota bacterium]